jgi:hypothetical protein
MRVLFEGFFDEHMFEFSLAALMTFAHVLPTCAATFREECLLFSFRLSLWCWFSFGD